MFIFCWLIGSSSLFIDELSILSCGSNPLPVVNSNVLINFYDLDAFLLYPWRPWAVFLRDYPGCGERKGALQMCRVPFAVSKLLMFRLWHGTIIFREMFWRVPH